LCHLGYGTADQPSRGELRDGRERGWWWVDNETSSHWRAKLGPIAWSVYTLLIEMAGNDGNCWPSYATTAERCGISRRSAVSAVRALVDAGLVAVTERRRKGTNERTSNFYLILGGSAPAAPPVVQDVHPNKTQVNKTQEQESDPKVGCFWAMTLDYATLPDKLAREVRTMEPRSWTAGVLTLQTPAYLARRRALADELLQLLVPVAPVDLHEVRIVNGQ
jgi:pyocin large subunit-like protein